VDDSATATADEAAPAEKPKRKTSSTRTPKPAGTRAKSTKVAADVADQPDQAEPAKKTTTRRRTTKAAAETPADEG
jgi:hypothetical protein